MRNKKRLSTYAKMVMLFWFLFGLMFGSFFVDCLIEVNVQNDSALYGRSYSYSENNVFVIIANALKEECAG